MKPQKPEWQRDAQDTGHILQGTLLFDYVHAQFCSGIVTLDNLLRHMELTGAAQCKGFKTGIDSLLDNLVALARWLVDFLYNAWECDDHSEWARAAVIGLRVEMHQYSWKVMRIAMMMKRSG